MFLLGPKSCYRSLVESTSAVGGTTGPRDSDEIDEFTNSRIEELSDQKSQRALRAKNS
jgi:hypothetical protein